MKRGTWNYFIAVAVALFSPAASFVRVYAQTSAVPQISSINPTTIRAGGPDFVLTVEGANFTEGSYVNWNGEPLRTTFINTTQLTATVPSAFISLATDANISVVTGALFSNLVKFTLTGLTVSVMPVRLAAGGPAVTLAVLGSGFQVGATMLWTDVSWDPHDAIVLPTEFVSVGQLNVPVASNLIANPGNISVRIINPDGDASNYVQLIVIKQVFTAETEGLIGITYDHFVNKNEVRTMDAVTGNTVLLNSFTPSSPTWAPNTLSVDLRTSHLYAESPDQILYTFELTTGRMLNRIFIGMTMEAMRARQDDLLIGIDFDTVKNQYEVRTVHSTTGTTDLLNSFTFRSGGWAPGTFCLNVGANRFYAQAVDRTLYTFDLTTGRILALIPTEVNIQVLAARADGLLIGIARNLVTLDYEIRSMNPVTGATVLLNTFNFSSNGWNLSTFTLDRPNNRIFAQSAPDGTVYTFDAMTGSILATAKGDTLLEAMASFVTSPHWPPLRR